MNDFFTPAHMRAFKRIGLTLCVVRKRAVARAECASCLLRDDFTFPGAPSADFANKHFNKRGWRTGQKTICPKCSGHNKKFSKGEESEMTDAKTPSPIARKSRLDALDLPRDEFDVENGTYRNGSSDKVIAETCGLSEQAIAALRDEFFGPIKEPEEIATIKMLISEAKGHASEAASLAGRANSMIAKADVDFRALCAKHGWKA